MKITFLGTGTSHGVPPIDCMINNYQLCPQEVCKESFSDAKHKRTRTSIFIENKGLNILIDIGPDFRTQCLREGIKKIDAVLITHAHIDHIGGIPDIRSYTKEKSIPVYGSEESVKKIINTFSYIFEEGTLRGGGIPEISTTIVNDIFFINTQKVTPLKVEHLGLNGCYGFLIDSLCYIPDVKKIPEDVFQKLKNIELLILNCLRREKPHCSHLTLPESIEIAKRIAPAKCLFVHMSHDIHYKKDKRYLMSWMDFAYDGLQIDI